MCDLCECRKIDQLREYVASHERAVAHGHRALRAIAEGLYIEAQGHVDAMAEELRAHWQGEENGVFALMIDDPVYREHIEPLIGEKRALDALLRTLDVTRRSDQALLGHQMDELREFIRHEGHDTRRAKIVEFSGG